MYVQQKPKAFSSVEKSDHFHLLLFITIRSNKALLTHHLIIPACCKLNKINEQTNRKTHDISVFSHHWQNRYHPPPLQNSFHGLEQLLYSPFAFPYSHNARASSGHRQHVSEDVPLEKLKQL